MQQSGDYLIKKRRQRDMSPNAFDVRERRFSAKTFSSPFLISLIFLILITIGTILLLLPYAHYGSGFSDPIVAIFTATSAVTVTGLVIEPTHTYWTGFGQAVILALMFVGGLGIMTMAAFLLAILGQKVSTSQKLLIRETMNTSNIGGIQSLSIAIVGTAIAIQLVGFILFLIRFVFIYPLDEAIWQSLFHSVSAFNNAGFLSFNSNEGLIEFQSDFIVISIMTWLIIFGSLSFWVVADIFTKNHFRLYSLVSKIVIITTVFLIVLSSILFFFSERSNIETIGNLDLSNQIFISIFESVSGRTAGFTTIDYSAINDSTTIIQTIMMFIGGATGSVAGGIKVTTLFVIIVSIFALIRENPEIHVFKRHIDQDTVIRSYAILVISLSFILICAFLLSVTNEGFLFKDLIFDSVSAYGTVGLSSGVTPELNVIGKIVIVVTMFLGRIGPLIIGLRMIPNQENSGFRYPNETVTIG